MSGAAVAELCDLAEMLRLSVFVSAWADNMAEIEGRSAKRALGARLIIDHRYQLIKIKSPHTRRP